MEKERVHSWSECVALQLLHFKTDLAQKYLIEGGY